MTQTSRQLTDATRGSVVNHWRRQRLSRRRLVQAAGGAALAAGTRFGGSPTPARAQDNVGGTLTILCWQGYDGPNAARFTRIPAGHPEGYLEAFGNIYREAFRAIAAEVSGQPLPKDLDFPTIDDGIEGMAFIETAVKSSKLGAKWVKMPKL